MPNQRGPRDWLCQATSAAASRRGILRQAQDERAEAGSAANIAACIPHQQGPRDWLCQTAGAAPPRGAATRKAAERGGLSSSFEIQRCRIHAVAQAGWGGPVGKHMAQVGTAACADRFRSRHSVGAVDMFFNCPILDFLGKTRPAATCIKFRRRVEQLGTAADAAVGACRLIAVVFACEWALGGRLARDLKSAGLSIFFSQQGFPLGIGFLNFWSHGGRVVISLQKSGAYELQLMAIDDAQSGGKPAKLSCAECSSYGDCSRLSKMSTWEKSFSFAARIASSPR